MPGIQNPTVTEVRSSLSEYVAGDHITYVKNDMYWNTEEPYVDTVILKIIPDQTTMGEALEAGEIDLRHARRSRMTSATGCATSDGITVYDIGKELRTTVYYIGLNSQSEKLASKDVRVALIEAIDQEALIEKAFNGYGQPT